MSAAASRPTCERVTRFAPEAEVAPGIRAVATNGHSPGHTSFLIADGTAQALVIGDAITTPAFFMVNPEWFPMFDMDPAMAVETRKRLLDRAATERMPVVGYHFDMPATGRVERAGTGYRLVPVGRLTSRGGIGGRASVGSSLRAGGPPMPAPRLLAAALAAALLAFAHAGRGGFHRRPLVHRGRPAADHRRAEHRHTRRRADAGRLRPARLRL